MTGRRKILVTGAAGQLGSAMVKGLDGCDVTGLTRADLDLTDHAGILARVEEVRPDVIVNCAADNRVDFAEDDPVPALRTNALAVRSLARAACGVDATLVHFSTDFVFDGAATRPYTEDDPTGPLGTYGASKLMGEWFARDAPRHYVLRVESLFGGPQARSSVDRILTALVAGEEARVFVDRTVSPSYVADVTAATRALLDRRAPFGLYHCVNSGWCTWAELGTEAARLLGVPPRLQPVRVEAVRLRAGRPKFAALSPAKLASVGIEMPDWRDGLRRYIDVRRTATL